MQIFGAGSVSILTLGEYRKGIEKLEPDDSHRPQLERLVAALAERFAGRVLPVTGEIVLRWGSISGQTKHLHRQAPPIINTLLAATALEHNLYFVTRDVADAAKRCRCL